jgi:hypothetical protein
MSLRNRKNQSRQGVVQDKKTNSRIAPGRRSSVINTGDLIVKRMTFATVLATGAGTTIPVSPITSGAVQSFPASEWSSFAARYQEYRVRVIRVRGRAVNPVQSATISHSAMYRGDYLGVSLPSSNTQVLSDERVHICTTSDDFVDEVTWAGNPNAKLWNPTNAALPAANQFAWVGASSTLPVMTTATTYYAVTVEYVVEFRGSQ